MMPLNEFLEENQPAIGNFFDTLLLAASEQDDDQRFESL